MSENSNFINEPMLEMFVFETNQLLEKLEELLLVSEKDNYISAENINEIFRIMHTIKGSSAMMMFSNISSVSHSVEDLFYYIRESKPKDLDYSAVCDIVLSVLDFIKGQIIKIEEGNEPDGNETELVGKIKNHLSSIKGNMTESSDHTSIDKPNDNSKFYISPNKIETIPDKFKYTAKIFFEEDCQMENIRAYALVSNLREICGKLYHRPVEIIEDNESSEYIAKNGFDLYFSSNKDENEISDFLNDTIFLRSLVLNKVESFDEQITDIIEHEQVHKDFAEASQECLHPSHQGDEEKDSSAKSLKQNLISVNITKLDKLLDLVGEIVITESMVTRSPDLTGLKLDNFSKAARQLRKLHDELQDVVMSIRMIPIAATFQKMQRIVRDMSKKLGKEVQLEIRGEETEVDKNIIDNLSDPLMHLIRNSMDHGIEDNKQRLLKGKPVKGKIILEAKNVGGDVTISITDDGKGINKESVIKKARENGLINRPENLLTDKEIYSFILLPGFSTKEKVTEFSGRGVGMDVVKKNIEKVGGSVSIESEEGRGTTIFIKIPLTLAIIDGMEIAVGGSVYTLPTISIKESFRPKEENIITDPDGNEMIMIRGNCYSLIRLHKVFNIKTDVTDIQKGIIIVIELNLIHI